MNQETSDTIHATSVAIDGRGVLIMGPSGAGKSDLALRLIDRGAILISDDYTTATRHDGQLLLGAPPTIAGRMEIRHLGIVDMPHVEAVPAALAIRLDEAPQRMPETIPTIRVAGIPLPLVALAGKEPSAPIKAELALRRFDEAKGTP
ncbi:MAG TPA: aldolase [Sphingobium sp.]|nr:aldolase [Sphingobium sp.]